MYNQLVMFPGEIIQIFDKVLTDLVKEEFPNSTKQI